MIETVSISGFRELEAEFAKLAKPATRRSSAARALRVAAAPFVDLAKSHAPVRSGSLRDSIKFDSRALGAGAGRQAFRQAMREGATRAEAGAAARDANRSSAALVERYVGPGRHPQAIFQEFGTVNHAPHPFMRPAWDQDRHAMLDRIKRELWADIQRSVARAARRAAREATRG